MWTNKLFTELRMNKLRSAKALKGLNTFFKKNCYYLFLYQWDVSIHFKYFVETGQEYLRPIWIYFIFLFYFLFFQKAACVIVFTLHGVQLTYFLFLLTEVWWCFCLSVFLFVCVSVCEFDIYHFIRSTELRSQSAMARQCLIL